MTAKRADTTTKLAQSVTTARWFKDHRWWAAAAAGVVTFGGIGSFLLFNASDQAPRARQYTASRACLLTGDRGITDPQAASVWAGMEDASLATHAKVTYLSVTGPATSANAIPYANSLVQQHCDVVLATGAPQTTAITQIAHRNPRTHFVLLSTTNIGSSAQNVTILVMSTRARNDVAHTVETFIGQ